MSAVASFIRFDLAGAIRSRWFLFVGAVYGLLFALFVWLGLRESAVLGFTGLSRVVLNLTNITLLVIPILVLVATSQTIVHASVSGSLEWLLSQPAKRSQWFFSLVFSRALVVLGPITVLIGIATVLGLFVDSDSAALALTALRALSIVFSLAFAFLGIGLLISALAGSEERAILYALVAWLFCSALHDFALIGALLQTDMPPAVVFALAAMNPVEAARVALLTQLDAQVSTLGPVGFWLANHFGTTWTYVTGVAWPLGLGAGCLALAARRFARADLVG